MSSAGRMCLIAKTRSAVASRTARFDFSRTGENRDRIRRSLQLWRKSRSDSNPRQALTKSRSDSNSCGTLQRRPRYQAHFRVAIPKFDSDPDFLSSYGSEFEVSRGPAGGKQPAICTMISATIWREFRWVVSASPSPQRPVWSRFPQCGLISQIRANPWLFAEEPLVCFAREGADSAYEPGMANSSHHIFRMLLPPLRRRFKPNAKAEPNWQLAPASY